MMQVYVGRSSEELESMFDQDDNDLVEGRLSEIVGELPGSCVYADEVRESLSSFSEDRGVLVAVRGDQGHRLGDRVGEALCLGFFEVAPQVPSEIAFKDILRVAAERPKLLEGVQKLPTLDVVSHWMVLEDNGLSFEPRELDRRLTAGLAKSVGPFRVIVLSSGVEAWLWNLIVVALLPTDIQAEPIAEDDVAPIRPDRVKGEPGAKYFGRMSKALFVMESEESSIEAAIQRRAAECGPKDYVVVVFRDRTDAAQLMGRKLTSPRVLGWYQQGDSFYAPRP